MSSGGHFILKPPVAAYPYLPELEDLSMHLASIAQIKTASHSLIRLQSGELAYITQRTDRTKKGKLPQEDMCQLSGTLTEDKYQGSMEKIGKMIHTHSSNPGFDVISFFELALFCFLTGNAHMHLKNFSLLSSKENDIGLAPAFNLVPTKLLHPEDKEEMALSINGKKKNLKKSDFDALAEKLKINAKTLDNTYKRFHKALPQMLAFTDLSFLSEEMKQNYKDLIKQRAQELFGFRTEELPKKRPQEVEEKQTIDLIKETAEEFPDQVYKDPFSRQLSLFPI
jgi:serine/threonine-protein kinase HipA